jgi:hypothetical protein
MEIYFTVDFYANGKKSIYLAKAEIGSTCIGNDDLLGTKFPLTKISSIIPLKNPVLNEQLPLSMESYHVQDVLPAGKCSDSSHFLRNFSPEMLYEIFRLRAFFEINLRTEEGFAFFEPQVFGPVENMFEGFTDEVVISEPSTIGMIVAIANITMPDGPTVHCYDSTEKWLVIFTGKGADGLPIFRIIKCDYYDCLGENQMKRVIDVNENITSRIFRGLDNTPFELGLIDVLHSCGIYVESPKMDSFLFEKCSFQIPDLGSCGNLRVLIPPNFTGVFEKNEILRIRAEEAWERRRQQPNQEEEDSDEEDSDQEED